LDKVYAYDHALTKNVFATLKRMEPNLMITKTLDYDAAEAHMQANNLSIEAILNEFEPLYKELLMSNDWPPAMNKTDKKAPELNLAAEIRSMTDSELEVFISKKVEATLTKGRGGNTAEHPDRLDRLSCHQCRQEGHKKPDCPNKDAPTVDALPTIVNTADPQVVQFKGKCKFWCRKCGDNGCWTTSHATSQHKGGKLEPLILREHQDQPMSLPSLLMFRHTMSIPLGQTQSSDGQDEHYQHCSLG
jgi:hypothetical protein